MAEEFRERKKKKKEKETQIWRQLDTLSSLSLSLSNHKQQST